MEFPAVLFELNANDDAALLLELMIFELLCTATGGRTSPPAHKEIWSLVMGVEAANDIPGAPPGPIVLSVTEKILTPF